MHSLILSRRERRMGVIRQEIRSFYDSTSNRVLDIASFKEFS